MKSEAPIIVIVAKWPSISETFIAQEILGLEKRGLDLRVVSLRSDERETHDLHKRIRSPVIRLPRRLIYAPIRVIQAVLTVARGEGRRRAFKGLWDHLRGLPFSWGVGREAMLVLRRFGQACVLSVEVESIGFLYAHFLTQASEVAYYTALIRNRPWGFSAHAMDIWRTSDPERKRHKIQTASWGVVCSRKGLETLHSLTPQKDKISLLYHGLDFSRFPSQIPSRPTADGSCPQERVRLLTVCRIREKKGLDILIKALARLPPDLWWRWTHIGGSGETKEEASLRRLKQDVDRLGLSERISWYGQQSQEYVIQAYLQADLFVLPCRQAKDLDQDGLPNVLMEAQYLKLPCISTSAGGIPELIVHNQNGILVSPEDVFELSQALEDLIRSPSRRAQLALNAHDHVRERFNCDPFLDRLFVKLTTDQNPDSEAPLSPD